MESVMERVLEPMTVWPVRTPVYRAGALSDFIVANVPRSLIKERMVLAITSKIVSLAEGRLIPRAETDKATLVKREADVFLGEIGYGCFLTVKAGLLIPSAGIDESNSESGDFILYPKDPFASAEELREKLRQAWGLNELGVVMTDSHTTPLRRGVTGISLAHAGFSGLRRMVGSKDLFGRELQMTNMNLADGLAATTVLMMGEGAESTPLAVVHGADLKFSDWVDRRELEIPLSEDLYAPLLSSLREH